MSAMDVNSSRIDRSQTGRLFAVLWILAAALAMQFVVSAQGLSARLSPQQNAGNVSLPEKGTSDTALSRHVVRAFPVADLRFTTDRADGKASPGGSGPFVLPALIFVAALFYGSMPATAPFRAVAKSVTGYDVRVRGPPVVGA